MDGMRTFIRAAAACAAVLAGAGAPLAGFAATASTAQPQHYAFQTELTDRYHAGAYVGTLALTVYPDGIVNGTYRPDNGAFHTVTGGVEGTSIWLDVGSLPNLHLTGTLQNGVLRTSAATRDTVFEFDSIGS